MDEGEWWGHSSEENSNAIEQGVCAEKRRGGDEKEKEEKAQVMPSA